MSVIVVTFASIKLYGLNSLTIPVRGRSKRTSPRKWQFLDPPSPMSPLVTISGYPLPPCHRINSYKLLLRIQVTKTIWGHFNNTNDTRNYDKSAKFLK